MKRIKRATVTCIALLLCSFSVSSQEGGTSAKKDNLYSLALFASLSEMEKSWGHLDDSDNGSAIRTNYRHMLAEKDPEITNGLPSQLGEFRVEFLADQQQKERYHQLRKGYSILRIRPIQNDGSTLRIEVSVSYVRFEKGKFTRGVSDWSDVEFRYDCEQQKYVITSIKLGGI
jgi:hypothetical protein